MHIRVCWKYRPVWCESWSGLAYRQPETELPNAPVASVTARIQRLAEGLPAGMALSMNLAAQAAVNASWVARVGLKMHRFCICLPEAMSEAMQAQFPSIRNNPSKIDLCGTP